MSKINLKNLLVSRHEDETREEAAAIDEPDGISEEK